jgi:cytochrome c oxidase subunit 2
MSQLILILTLQGLAGIISLAGALIVIASVILLIATSAKSGKESKTEPNAYKKRIRYFIGLGVALVALSFVLLQFLSWHSQGKVDEVITVVGIQWDWQMAHGITNKTPHQFLGKNEISVPAGKRIKFIIMSDDVTHNFGIYNSKGILLAQALAMPQYKNELVFVFAQKGKYPVLCLEYCGLVHPFMTATIDVH